MAKGIDVSKWNGDIDFKKVKSAGIDFVMIRAGYGKYTNQKDDKFEQNYKNATAAGLNVGAYWYSYAATEADAIAEAATFLKVIKGKSFNFPLAFDIEERTQYNLGTAKVEKIINAFCGAIEKAGYYCMLYSYESFLTERTKVITRKKYDIWCANISRKPSINCGIHQYSFKGKIDGIKGDVDLNTTDKNYNQIIKAAGLNGFKKTSGNTTTTTTSKPTAEKVTATYKTYTVVKGDSLWSIAQKFLKNGSRYTEIKKLNGLKSDTIYAGQKLKIPVI